MADETGKPNQDQAVEPAASAAASGAPGEQTPDVATLEGRIAELTDRLLRAHAEMDNLRKRTERDKEDTAKYAISKFAREVLSIGDNLQRAMAAVPPGAADADPALKALIDGVSMPRLPIPRGGPSTSQNPRLPSKSIRERRSRGAADRSSWKAAAVLAT